MPDMRLDQAYDKLMSHEVPRKDALDIVNDKQITKETRFSYLNRLFTAISGGQTLQGLDMDELCKRIKNAQN